MEGTIPENITSRTFAILLNVNLLVKGKKLKYSKS